MKIYLVRHGETDWNKMRKWQGHTNIELNETGINQATVLSQTIGEYSNISVIYASPLKRAYKTAEILNQSLCLEIIPRDGLKEVKLGAWEGMNYDDVAEQYPDDFKLWNSCSNDVDKKLGVETLIEVRERALSELDKLRKLTDTDFLIVGHGAWIGSLIQKLTNDVDSKKLLHVENAKLIEIEYNVERGEYRVVTDVKH